MRDSDAPVVLLSVVVGEIQSLASESHVLVEKFEFGEAPLT